VRILHDTTLDLGALGKSEIRIEADYSPAVLPGFDAAHGAFRPGEPERIEIERVLFRREGGEKHAFELEILVERLGFDLEAHFADEIRQAATRQERSARLESTT
jgi:hypothetical protein